MILSADTVGWIAIDDVDDLSERWKKTQFGQFLADPAMEAFAKDLRNRIDGKWSGLVDDLGITLDDIQGISAGSLTVAIIHPADAPPALLMLTEVGNDRQAIDELVAKISAGLKKRGAKESKRTLAATEITHYALPAKDRRPGGSGEAIYFVKDHVLCAADRLSAAEDVLKRWAGDAPNSLGKQVPFQAVMDRCGRDAGDVEPQVRWYANPLRAAAALSILYPPQEPQPQDMLKILRTEGFEAIRAVGGHVFLTLGDYDLLHRTSVFAPPPYERSARMLVFPNVRDLEPMAWLPADLASYASFNCDLKNAFAHCGTLFDQTIGEGEEGVFEDTLESIRTDPEGPQIDIEKDLVAHLGTRITVATDYKLPITVDSERMLFAIETINPASMAATIERAMKDDPGVRRHEIAGHVIWELSAEEIEQQAPEIEFDDPLAIQTTPQTNDGKPDAGQGRLLPRSAITVAHGHVLVASHIEFLELILQPAELKSELAKSPDYQRVGRELEKLGAKEACLRMFRRTDREHQATYELLREGKLPVANTVVAKLLNAVLGGTEEKPREAEVDGSSLPEFSQVRRYFGPAGMYAASEENGWIAVGFTLRHDDEAARNAADAVAERAR